MQDTATKYATRKELVSQKNKKRASIENLSGNRSLISVQEGYKKYEHIS